MRRMPKIFWRSSDDSKIRMESGSGSSRSRRASNPKPRLDRRNAAKNISYEPSASGSSASSSYSSEESVRTRSLDLYGGKTSFRIEGIDGEFEIMCQTLGFSGIDDFTIPAEEYESMKVRSLSDSNVFSRKKEPVVNIRTEANCDGGVGVGNFDVASPKIEDNDSSVRFSNDFVGEVIDLSNRKRDESPNLGFCSGFELSKRLGDNLRLDEESLSDNAIIGSNKSRGTGIRGFRPPLLAAPPFMSLPVFDQEVSTWDILKAFGPDNGTGNSCFERGYEKNDFEEDMRRVMMNEEKCVLSESCSFTTSSNDDDSSSSTVTPSISPVGSSKFNIVEWEKGGLLGRGSYGSVYEVYANDRKFYAMKEVSLLDQDDEGKQRIMQLEQEIALLTQFEHENIVQYHGTKKDGSHLYIFLELAKSSLLSLYQNYTLRDSQVSAYTRQILHGLKYLHDQRVIHRDIKCANILVDTYGSVKLADFGLAKAIKLNDVNSCKGTAFWMAPEVVRSRGYGLAADIWSLGCTVLEMLTRQFPYANLDGQMQAIYRIGQGELPIIPRSLSSGARDFILQCLQVDPNSRPTATQLLDHPFVKTLLPSSPQSFGRNI